MASGLVSTLVTTRAEVEAMCSLLSTQCFATLSKVSPSRSAGRRYEARHCLHHSRATNSTRRSLQRRFRHRRSRSDSLDRWLRGEMALSLLASPLYFPFHSSSDESSCVREQKFDRSGRSEGVAWVTFASEKHAAAAKEAFDGALAKGESSLLCEHQTRARSLTAPRRTHRRADQGRL